MFNEPSQFRLLVISLTSVLLFSVAHAAKADPQWSKMASMYAERLASFIPKGGRKADDMTTITDIYYAESRHTVRWEAVIDTQSDQWKELDGFEEIGRQNWSNKFQVESPNSSQATRWGIQVFMMMLQQKRYCSDSESAAMLASIELATEKVFYDKDSGEILSVFVLPFNTCEEGAITSLY